MTKIKQAGMVMVALAAGAVTTVAQPAKPSGTVGAVPNTADLADRIVGKTANVKEGDIVQISGGPTDIGFMEDLAVAVRKRGAFPIVTFWSESAERKLLASLPAKYDGQTPAADLGLAKLVNVQINLPAVRDSSIYQSLPAERQAAMAKAGAPVADTLTKRNVRVVELSNGLAPSPSRAKDLGLSEAELTKLYWDGLTADYASIEDKAKTLKETIAKGGELHITLPNGTDLKMKIKGRKVLTNDGVLSDADVKAGAPSTTIWLPAGEVFLAPVPGSVEGRLVDDRMIFQGKEILGVTAEIKAGKITSISAKSGWDAIKGRYDAAGPGKNDVGVFDIGVNPNVKTGGKLETFIGAGTVSIGTGNNVWAGGTNKEPFSLTFQMAGATVTLDGKPLIDNGTLK